MSKVLAIRIIARGCLRFINTHGAAALPVLEAALTTFVEVVEMRVTEQQREEEARNAYHVSQGLLEERIAKLEAASARAVRQ